MTLNQYMAQRPDIKSIVDQELRDAHIQGKNEEALRQDKLHQFFGTKFSPGTKVALDNGLTPSQFILSQGDMLPRAKSNDDQFSVPAAPTAQQEASIKFWDKAYKEGK